MKISVIVIMYGKEINESKTLESLSKVDVEGIELTIFNNGPKEIVNYKYDHLFIALSSKFNNVMVKQDLNNSPLSNIYNDFIKEQRSSDCFVIFDDDSFVPNDYFNGLSQSLDENIDLIMPRIYNSARNKYYYPQVDDVVIKKELILLTDDYKQVYSVASGLVLFSRLVDIFESTNTLVFDERFALYGVDFSFFRRLNKLKSIGNDFKISISGVLDHDLSSLSQTIEPWRLKERLIDDVLSIKYYSSREYYRVPKLMRLIIREIFKCRFNTTFFILSVYLRGKHPRCN